MCIWADLEKREEFLDRIFLGSLAPDRSSVAAEPPEVRGEHIGEGRKATPKESAELFRLPESV